MKDSGRVVLRLLLITVSLTPGCGKDVTEQKTLDLELCRAAYAGELTKFRGLLERGADPNTTHCGEIINTYPYPLFFALLGVDRDAKQLVSQSGAGESSLEDRQRLAVMALLSAGADPNVKSKTKMEETPLMYAEYLRAGRIAQTLMEGGADPEARDARDKRAVDYAALRGEDFQVMNALYVVSRINVALHIEETAEKKLIDAIVPKK